MTENPPMYNNSENRRCLFRFVFPCSQTILGRFAFNYTLIFEPDLGNFKVLAPHDSFVHLFLCFLSLFIFPNEKIEDYSI
ncbi:hypothetical protein BD560DRAFT_395714, partial [Blakeslea trispora]